MACAAMGPFCKDAATKKVHVLNMLVSVWKEGILASIQLLERSFDMVGLMQSILMDRQCATTMGPSAIP